ncbi:hypothetical protein ACAW74_01565 [Fibrella sp. WM1]|uniref:hypothetical protein n=1 Tax=Fibrella musci TaxID=3242485 RepID=UPI003520B801
MSYQFVLVGRGSAALLMVWLLLSSCSTKRDVVDPRDAYVGTWIEKSTNGKAATVGQEDQLLVGKGATADAISLKGLTAADLSATANGTGYRVADGAINTGFVYSFPDKSTAPVYAQNLTATAADGQLTVTYNLLAQSSTALATGDISEVFIKK